MYFVCNFCQHNASCVCVCLVVASINMVTFIKQKQTFPYISFHAIFGDFLSCTSHVAECVISITETTLINFSLHVDLCYRYSRGLMCMYIPPGGGRNDHHSGRGFYVRDVRADRPDVPSHLRQFDLRRGLRCPRAGQTQDHRSALQQ